MFTVNLTYTYLSELRYRLMSLITEWSSLQSAPAPPVDSVYILLEFQTFGRDVL